MYDGRLRLIDGTPAQRMSMRGWHIGPSGRAEIAVRAPLLSSLRSLRLCIPAEPSIAGRPLHHCDGECYVIRWMRFRNSYPAQDYLESLNADSDRVKARLFALATMLADSGQVPSTQHGHFLSGPFSKVFEFKPFGHRFFAFVDGTTVYLTNGAPKRAKKAQEGDYQQALNLRTEFYTKKKPKKGEKK